ncbi:MAG: hypothetical protein E7510_13900 [Ruminococcus sp.]|nr:hypothetical protein [Ruminococcus sp.]
MKLKKIFASLVATVLAGNLVGGTVNAIDYRAAGSYAAKYNNSYNPLYADFNIYGGDCTNFVSQILKAGGMWEIIHPDDYFDYVDPNSEYNKYRSYKLNCPCLDCWSYDSLEYRSKTWSETDKLSDFLTDELGIEREYYWDFNKLLLEVEPGDIVLCSKSILPVTGLYNHALYVHMSHDQNVGPSPEYGTFHYTRLVGHSDDKAYCYSIYEGDSKDYDLGYASYAVIKTSDYESWRDYYVDPSRGLVPKWYPLG